MATCPTYRLTGDELDGPRGRIYLMKQALEGKTIGPKTQYHLDRCLSCRSCETTCPSGVEYGYLLDVGREIVDQQIARSRLTQLKRWLLRQIIPYPKKYAWMVGIAQPLRYWFPGFIREKIPKRAQVDTAMNNGHTRSMLVMEGCAQSVLTPQTNQAVTRVLGCLGIEVINPLGQGCCGAVSQHLSQPEEAKRLIRRNIDAWWPHIESGVEQIIVSASGCALQVKHYGQLLAEDNQYADKAKRVSAITRDLCEVVSVEDLSQLVIDQGASIAVHSPCTLQHGMKLPGVVEEILQRVGYRLVEVADQHICCGSAGTYSLLQPQMSKRLRSNKLEQLCYNQPDMIVTANVGCQLHLQHNGLPIKHWIELLDHEHNKH